MQPKKVINDTRAKMVRGKRFNLAEIQQYEHAIVQMVNDDRAEVMFLYFAEILHDKLGFGHKRVTNIVKEVDSRMTEWLEPDFNIDDLIVRVYEKTQFLFACTEEEYVRITELLKDKGLLVDKVKEVN